MNGMGHSPGEPMQRRAGRVRDGAGLGRAV